MDDVRMLETAESLVNQAAQLAESRLEETRNPVIAKDIFDKEIAPRLAQAYELVQQCSFVGNDRDLQVRLLVTAKRIPRLLGDAHFSIADAIHDSYGVDNDARKHARLAVDAYADAAELDKRAHLLSAMVKHQYLGLNDEAQAELHALVESSDDADLRADAMSYMERIRQQPNAAETKGCFIATAACGDAGAPEVRVLREFRDTVLGASAPGRAFVEGYYALSPTLARRIEGRPFARTMTRRLVVRPASRLAKLLMRDLARRRGE